MHALQWIAEHGCFLRTIGADRLRRTLRREKGRCTWCDGELCGARRCWCSDECVEAYKDRCWPQHITSKIMVRDGGVCCLCGLDTVEAKRLLKAIRENVGRGCLKHGTNYRLFSACRETLGPVPSWAKPAANRAYWRNYESMCRCIACVVSREYIPRWEADHIVPVVEGGGLCGLEGYRTLCVKCHQVETARLAKRLSLKKAALKRVLS